MLIPLFILVYLSPYLCPVHPTLASPVLSPSRRQQNSPPPPIPTSTSTSTWTYNYWWPYPPAGATPTPTSTTATDHITLVLPLLTSPASLSPSIDNTNQPSSAIDSSDAPASSTIVATSSVAPSPSPTSASSLNSLATSPPHRKFNLLYLIPLLAIVGVVILVGLAWLIYGCCTRKPKSRRRSSSRPGPGNDGFGDVKDKEEEEGFFVNGAGMVVDGATFRAFRYEDLPPAHPDQDPIYNAAHDGDMNEDEIPRCMHTREFGFECDCSSRQSVIESELLGQFRWPKMETELENVDEGDERSEEGGGCGEGEQGRDRVERTRTRRQRGDGGGAISPLSSIESSSELDFLSPNIISVPSSPSASKTQAYAQEGYFDIGGTIGRQTKLLEHVQRQEQHQHDQRMKTLPRPRHRKLTKLRKKPTRKLKKNKSAKSAKSTTSMRTFKTAWTECSFYSRRSSIADEEGFQMLAESPSSLSRSASDETIKALRQKTSDGDLDNSRSEHEKGQAKGEGDGGSGRWIDKMAGALGSTVSHLSGGGSGDSADMYTALPGGEPSDADSHHCPHDLSRNRPRGQSRDGADHWPSRMQLDPQVSTSAVRPLRRPQRDVDVMTEEELAHQRRMLQNHRASIASLPRGMMYSPPLVQGVVGFFPTPTHEGDVDGVREVEVRGRGKEKGREKVLPQIPSM